MSSLRRSLLWVLFLLLGVCACSDEKNAAKLGQRVSNGASMAKETADQPAGAPRQRLASRVKDVVISVKVKSRILKERVLSTSDIYVTTHDRVVVLTGTVEKPEDATRAIQIAQSVNDVESVDNKLAVRSGG